jgi:hypothetical protein
MDTTLQELNRLTNTPEGVLVYLDVQKAGTKTKRGVVGNDRVQVLLWTGVSTERIYAQSARLLGQKLVTKGYLPSLYRELKPSLPTLTLAEVCTGVQAVQDRLHRKVSVPSGPEFQPVWVGPQPVQIPHAVESQGYGILRQRPNGELFLLGLKLASRVVTQGAVRECVSRNTTVVSNTVESTLPISLIRSYRASKEHYQLEIGEDAVKAASLAGLTVPPEIFQILRGI